VKGTEEALAETYSIFRLENRRRKEPTIDDYGSVCYLLYGGLPIATP
jgi:hypothetical protein